jgi:hypothetical protein
MLALLLAAVVVLPSGAHFACTPTRVWDGDGPIWCAEGPRVRLAGIAAREIDESCKSGQPCPTTSGRRARDRLVMFLGGGKGRSRQGHILVSAPPMRCVSNGAARGDRTGAWCMVEGLGDLSCAMIASRTVLRWDRYARGHCL